MFLAQDGIYPPVKAPWPPFDLGKVSPTAPWVRPARPLLDLHQPLHINLRTVSLLTEYGGLKCAHIKL
jgi:hypothetical protein